ncbi:TPA: hypothetical protein ACPJZ8_004396 [Vibrio diabolicus]|uniref:hypothetical protein n=1 Tax=Vibrio TaxID=662 RepID=UPI001BD4086F|nr:MULTISPECIES: hypothetical protein [Vibrio]ELA7337574.1 hypothetical protein [Vibrio parahaemolyticus]MBS9836175.1 hypothetical protein [Vibrio alginolyticus]MBY4650233.1 hypothetical protein [Vibrio alginolyticus]MDW1907200.1 hypothetical protein [Vibrio sp. 705]
MLKKILLVVTLTLTGCQAAIYGTASELSNLELGLTKPQVIERLGPPVSVSADGDLGEEYLIYKKMKHAISSWPRTYQITLREGKVVKWGEQYSEQNIN